MKFKTGIFSFMQFDSFTHVVRYLDSVPKFQNVGKKAANFDLTHFRLFCEALGNPQSQFNSVHVGGTNGKGSTCQIAASVLQKAGYKTGLYTSPHILNFNERFIINETEVTDYELLLFFQQHESLVKSFRLSYFELCTAIAFWWFARQEVDLAIIEVGLGGRLDATNVIIPDVSVITSVSLDHTDILGDSIAQIAQEKAGIIKPGVPVIMGNLTAEAEEVMTTVANQQKCSLYSATELNPEYEAGRYILNIGKRKMILETGLEAPIQAFNIAAVWQVIQALKKGFPVAQGAFRKGIKEVRSIYPSLGRFEKMLPGRHWYFDGGHNYEAVRAMKAMAETIRPVRESVLVLSLMHDKINKELIKEFSEFKKIFYYSLQTERAASYEEVKKWMPEVCPLPVTPAAWISFFKEFDSELVIFAGSFYFYSTVRDWLASITFNR